MSYIEIKRIRLSYADFTFIAWNEWFKLRMFPILDTNFRP